MKRLLRLLGMSVIALIIMLCLDVMSVKAAGAVPINSTTFPDPMFRAVISGPDYDRDRNGMLDAYEIALTINIYCEGMNIYSLQGVEYFTALQGLWCKDNNISYMNLSNNRELRGVWCSGNNFTSLDFSANPELLWVYCYDCNLTSLNVSNNPKMAYIECNTNPLTYLDVTHNPELEHLTCGSCNLYSLDLSHNPKLSHLDAFRNHLLYLDVSHNPLLKRLDIWDNPGLGSIDISHNPGLQYYNCANNGAVFINVSSNPELQKLICSYNQIQALDLSHNPKLVYLDCACNQLASLDLTYNPQICFLQAFTNPFRALNIGNNPYLIKTFTEGVMRAEYAVCAGHSWTIDYGGLTSTGGDNIYFLCFDDGVLLNTVPAIAAPVSASGSIVGVPAVGDLVSRELAVYILYTTVGCPAVSGHSRFTDVQPGSWYESAVIWGEQNSICAGFPDVSSDTFGVGLTVTRQDLAFMLMRYSELVGYKRAIDFGRTDEYMDYYDIDYYAWEAMTWAVTWNIMEGKGLPGAPKSQQLIDPHGLVNCNEYVMTYINMLRANGYVI